VFRFRLRNGIFFHDGQAVTAEDIRWSMERMLDPKIGSPGFTFYTQLDGLDAYRQGQAKHIQGIQVLDPHTIEFRLKAPDQTFLNAMAMTFAYPVPRSLYETSPA
jgi:ABC-type transport system substrate-binding protein